MYTHVMILDDGDIIRFNSDDMVAFTDKLTGKILSLTIMDVQAPGEINLRAVNADHIMMILKIQNIGKEGEPDG